MILRALLAVLGLGTIALSGALVVEADEKEQLRKDVDALERRTTLLEQRTTRLEQARADDALRAEQQRLALEGLVVAGRRLAIGDDDVGIALDYAESVLSPHAAWSIRSARAAIANKDLGLAQQHVLQAIAESRLQPLPGGVR